MIMIYCLVERFYEYDMEISMMTDTQLTQYVTTTLVEDLHVDKSELVGMDLRDLIWYLEEELDESYKDSDVKFSGIIIVSEKNEYLIDWYRD